MRPETVRLKRLIGSLKNGAWGEDPEGGEGVFCVRAADFDYTNLRVSMTRAPKRAIPSASVASLALRPGDIVLEKSGGGENQPVGRAVMFDGSEPAVCSNFAARLRPASGVNSRHLTYLLASLYSEGATARCIKQTTGIQNLDTDAWLSTEVPNWPTDTQRLIADFLDNQVSRIDEAVRLRREQVEALSMRSTTATDAALSKRGWSPPSRLEATAVHPLPDGWRVARLSQVLRQLTNGFVGPTRDILVDHGVRYVQGMHIKGGEIAFDRRHFYVTHAWHAARPRIHLREGDVLIVQTGDIGRVAVVPPDFGEASCHALQIARVHEPVLSGQYLGAFLSSSFGYHSLLSRATGALHPHLEGSIRSVPVIVPPDDAQGAIVAEVQEVRDSVRQAQLEMTAQIDLLMERKRSLITAAVTGEFDVTTASGRGI